jgi:RNA polymerase sigma factor (sigma-70 family)
MTPRRQTEPERQVERFARDASGRLVARMRQRFGDALGAEDAVQEALVRAWQLAAAGDGVRSLDGWMATAASNLARDEWRRREAERRALERSARLPAAGGQANWPEGLRHLGPVAEAVQGLPRRQAQVVVLHYYGDLEVREIAALLDLSDGAVKSTLHHARNALRRTLGEHRRATNARKTMKGWHMSGSHPANYDHGRAEGASPDGKPVARLWSITETPTSGGFGTLMQMVVANDFLDRRMQLSGALRTRDVDGRAGLWMRIDGPGSESLGFDNMDDRPVTGTSDWARHTVVLDVPPEATAVAFGVLLIGTGQVWMADFRLDEVGEDVPVTAMQGQRLAPHPVNLDFAQP